MKIDKQELAKEVGRILSGLPEGTTIEEACAIKAARGDAGARQLLARLNSREWRLGDALLKAAFDEHPSWVRIGEGVVLRLDPDAPEDDELIEWFQKNYPHQARAIERSILDN